MGFASELNNEFPTYGNNGVSAAMLMSGATSNQGGQPFRVSAERAAYSMPEAILGRHVDDASRMAVGPVHDE